MLPFLDKIAGYITENHKTDIDRLCIVLPNRRGGLFLRKYIAVKLKQTVWSPEIYSIRDFINKLAEVEISDQVNLLFRFYKIYIKAEGETAVTFDDFMQWAPTLLNDFNEADEYLADTDKLFSLINEARAIQIWNVGNPTLTDYQKHYLKFWRALAGYYKKLTDELESSSQAYQGMACRKAADNIENQIKKYKWSGIIFAGFNALSRAEETIMRKLIKIEKAEIFWDADTYYTGNDIHEAGKFIRQYKHGWTINKLNWEENNIASETKDVVIAGVAGNTGQAKYAGEILKSLYESGNARWDTTAVVLADESLLPAVLNSLPEEIKDINVTMGYPLSSTPLAGLAEALFRLHENCSYSGNETKFYYKDILKVIRHPYYSSALKKNDGISAENISINMQKQNKVFYSQKEIESLYAKHNKNPAEILTASFSDWKYDTGKALKYFSVIIDSIKAITEKNDVVEMEQLYYFARLIKKLVSLADDNNEIKEIKTLRIILNQLIRSENVSFYGEPLKGLQIMGVLETRTLDFETVILLSCNEHIFPAAKTYNSFIPYDIRKQTGLPLHSDRTAIFAYHFYRLIQRAKNVFILYNSEIDGFGKGEKSRFIMQLEHELPENIKISHRMISMPSPETNEMPVVIKKNDDIIKKLDLWAESGISPSALSTYINCPLDFYYKYVLRLEQKEEVEETIDAATLGDCIHKVLFKMYEPYENTYITSEAVKAMLPDVNGLTRKVFQKHYSSSDISKGKNLLILEVAVRFIENFLKKEAEELISYIRMGATVSILSLEKTLNAEMIVSIDGIDKKIIMKGTADRIDRVGSTTRIVDYKTGNVESKNITLNNEPELLLPEKTKAFQLLAYAWLFTRMAGSDHGKLESGIIPFRTPSKGLMNVSFNGSQKIDAETLIAFENCLKKVIRMIYDKTVPFEHNHEAEYCKFC